MLSRAAGNHWASLASHSCTISNYCTIYLFIWQHCHQNCYKCVKRSQIHSGLNIVEKAGYKIYRQTTINPEPIPANKFLN
jgi:hypothetical protein